MDISVTFRHMEPTEALKDYARSKLERIKKFMRRPIEAHVVFSVEKHYQVADVTLHVNGISIRGQERTGDMYSSIDLVIDKLDQQIRRYKERLRDHHARSRRTALPPPSFVDSTVVAAEHADSGPRTRIVKTEKIPAAVMSLDDAVMRMDLSRAPFLVFTNAADGRLCVMYRHDADGHYGLVESGATTAATAAAAAKAAKGGKPAAREKAAAKAN